MSRRLCPREQDVVDAMLPHGRLPEDSQLQQHVAGCESCRELHEVMVMLRPDHARADEASLPSAGQIWWRAAVRARMEAARAAARPVGWAQGATAASLLGIVVAAAAFAWPFVQRVADAAFGRLSAGLDTSALQSLPVMAMIERSVPLAVGVVAVVVLAPLLVLYFALAGDE
jgi:hypothetical protein